MATFLRTTATEKILKLSKRIRAVPGGTSASKTISILMYLIDQAGSDDVPTITSIVSESFPHLRRGAMRDFLNIMESCGYFKEDNWDKTNSIYTFETGSKIEFFSADQPDKVRGARRDRLFMNEANNMPLETFNQLEVRTNEFIFLDWNPSSEFWFYTEVKDVRKDVDLLTLTYKDNEALNEEIVKSIEQRKHNKSWWRVYGLGLLGTVEGRIYNDWKIIDEVPHEAHLVSYGLDFGYTNDPSSIVAIYKWNGGYILDEILYARGFNNKQISDILLDKPKAVVIADAAEPKSIDEIKLYGIAVLPSTKGKGSVMQRITFVQSQRIWITKQSVNVIKEYRNYLWMTDDDGKSMNQPEHAFSHSMDAIGYGLSTRIMNRDSKKEQEAWNYKQEPHESPGFDYGKVKQPPRVVGRGIDLDNPLPPVTG